MGIDRLRISFHVFVVLVSIVLALSLPFIISVTVKSLPVLWTLIENGKIFPVIEVCAAIAFIVFFNLLRHERRNRKLVRMAKNAGLVGATPFHGLSVSPRTKKGKNIKDGQGLGLEIMIIGSTGYRSFVKPEGDLYEPLQNCREAKIMLLDPREHGAIVRTQSIPDPEITTDVIREQIIKTIAFIKDLSSRGKKIRLKLYPDTPLLKMAILGDCVYVRHYHTGMNVRYMPEFAFKNIPEHGGLYMPLYRYFLSRWQDPGIPEYDLDTDELVYHDHLGYEVLREPFDGITIMQDEKQINDEDFRSRYVVR